MKYNVTAQAFDPKTGTQLAPARVETIDTVTNAIFRDCKTVLQVKEKYEGFWNYINQNAPNERELVFVQRVEPAS